MKNIVIIGLLFVTAGISCSNHKTKKPAVSNSPLAKESSNPKLLNSYKEVPLFIQKAMMPHIPDTSAIADPSEEWDAGCITMGKPRIKFGWAKLWDDRFQMTYYTGGIAVATHFIEFEFEGETIKKFTVNK